MNYTNMQMAKKGIISKLIYVSTELGNKLYRRVQIQDDPEGGEKSRLHNKTRRVR